MTPKLLTTADAEEWEAALPASRSAFGSIGFARVQEQAAGATARLLVADGFVKPLLLKPIEGTELFDAATPPFTGPLLTGMPDSGEEAAALLAGEGIVTEFDHISLFDTTLATEAEPDREVVWVDVTLDPERQWAEYTKACRKNVRRAEREGVTVRAAESATDVSAFHRIYISTMDRNEALDSYYFDEAYFQAIFELMPGSARFAIAEHGGRVIAATLYLHDDADVYSYLGGADHSSQQVRPTNAVVHETIAWGREQHKRRLVLGGGYRPDDGIFRFKASFSPRRATLDLARRVHRAADYERLVAEWRERNHGADETAFFPLYRSPA